MKLLIITGDFPPVQSGEANHALCLATHLAARGLEVEVLTSRIPNAVTPAGVTVYPIMDNWRWRSLPKLKRFLRRSAPQAVLLLYLGFMYGGHPLITFAPTVAKRILPGLTFVTQFEHIHGTGWPQPLLARLLQEAMRYRVGYSGTSFQFGSLLRDSDHVIVLSDMHRDELASVFPGVRSKSTLITPPPIMKFCANDAPTVARTRASLDLTREHFVLIYYGYIYYTKGVETLLKAVRLVSERHPELRLIMCGGFLDHPLDGATKSASLSYEAMVKNMPHELGIADKVIWTGACPVDDDRASLYMHAADAGVFPFDSGVHLNNSSVAAAVSHGLPLVTTRDRTTESAFVDGTNSLLCPPKDPAALAAAIELLIDRGDVKERLRRGALAFANDWFSLDRIIDRTLDSFGGALAPSTGRGPSAAAACSC